LRYFFYLIIFLLAGKILSAQQNFVDVVAKYYRVNPFAGSFSAFVKALTTDPKLLNKTILHKTDSTGYYAKGEYKVFNPFSMQANKVDMLFYEREMDFGDKMLSYYSYQLTVYFPNTEAYRKAVKKDYTKLSRLLQRVLPLVDIESLKGFRNISDGETTTFSDSYFAVKPVIISWQTLDKSNQLALSVVTNLIHMYNRVYPVSKDYLLEAIK